MQMKLGLTPEEMINTFNQMYLEVWEKTRDRVDWEAANVSKRLSEGVEVDLAELLLRVLEVVVTASRDAAIVTILHNNQKVEEDLRRAGITLAEAAPASPLMGRDPAPTAAPSKRRRG